MKFGLIIDFDLLKAAIATNAKPEIVFSVRGRHLDKDHTLARCESVVRATMQVNEKNPKFDPPPLRPNPISDSHKS